MEDKTNRKAEVHIGMSYCEPSKDTLTFLTVASGTIATKAGKTSAVVSPMNRIFIPEGFDKVDCEIERDVMVKFWEERETYWEKLAKLLQ